MSVREEHSSASKTAVRLFLFVGICLCACLAVHSQALASEDCMKQGGVCRTACGQNESSEPGAFEDCKDKEECCMFLRTFEVPVRCCIYTFDSSRFGLRNCVLPINGICVQGAGSPKACSDLAMCRE